MQNRTSLTRQVVSAPVAWSGPTVAWSLPTPSIDTSTEAPGAQNPQTIACFGAAASTMPFPSDLANPKGIGAGGGAGPGGGGGGLGGPGGAGT